MDDWYHSFWDTALKYNEGSIREAEHFMDTNVYMFYYRIKEKSAWIEWHNQNIKAQTTTKS